MSIGGNGGLTPILQLKNKARQRSGVDQILEQKPVTSNSYLLKASPAGQTIKASLPLRQCLNVTCDYMETASKYEVPIFLRDKKLQISTISPNGLYFYKIKTPKDLYWGLFCSPIAFYDKSGNLIYHKQMQLAQFGLSEDNPWKIVAWSSSGTIVYFIERISIDNCWHVFLDLKHKKVCRIQWEREDANLFKSFGEGNFPDSVILEGKIFEFKDFEPEKVKLTISDLFGISGWRPN